jgi:hypothetical protein
MKNLIHILNNYHDPFPHIQGRGGLQYHPSRRIIGGMLGGAEETEIIPTETEITTSEVIPSFDDSDDEENKELSQDEVIEYMEKPPDLSNYELNYYSMADDDELNQVERDDLKISKDLIDKYKQYIADIIIQSSKPDFILDDAKKEFKKNKKEIDKLIIRNKKFIKMIKSELAKNPNEIYEKYLKINLKLKQNVMHELVQALYHMHQIEVRGIFKIPTAPKEFSSETKTTIDNKLDAKFIYTIDEKLKNGEVVNFKKSDFDKIKKIKGKLIELTGELFNREDGKRFMDEILYMNDTVDIIDGLPERIEKRKKENEKKQKIENEKILAEQAIIAKAKEEEFLKELEKEDKGKKSKKKDKKALVKMELPAEEPEPEVIEAEEPEPEKVSKKKGGKKEKAIAVETVVDTRTNEQREADLLKQNVIIATDLDKAIDNIFTMSDHKGDALTLNDRNKLLAHYIKIGELPNTDNVLKTITKLQIKLSPSKNQLELYRKTQATIDTNKNAFDILDADVLKLMEGTKEQPETYSAGDAWEKVLFKKGQNLLKSLTKSKTDFYLNSEISSASSRSTEGIMKDFSSGLDLETLKRAFTYDLLNELFCIEAKNYYTMFFVSELKQCGGVVMQISKFIGRSPFVGSTEQGYYKPYYIIQDNKLKLYNVLQSYKPSASGSFEQKWVFGNKSKAKEIFFNVKCRDCIVGMNIKDLPLHLETVTDPIGTRTDLYSINIEKSIAKGVLMKGDTDDTVKIPISYFKPII